MESIKGRDMENNSFPTGITAILCSLAVSAVTLILISSRGNSIMTAHSNAASATLHTNTPPFEQGNLIVFPKADRLAETYLGAGSAAGAFFRHYLGQAAAGSPVTPFIFHITSKKRAA
jgi:hypothetical protein